MQIWSVAPNRTDFEGLALVAEFDGGAPNVGCGPGTLGAADVAVWFVGWRLLSQRAREGVSVSDIRRRGRMLSVNLLQGFRDRSPRAPARPRSMNIFRPPAALPTDRGAPRARDR